jgi:hypothetical protein
VVRSTGATRIDCYCRDCQAYAHALDAAHATLDPLGGTNILPTLQQHVSWTAGAETLACLSLSERGLLRWYASCCSTPMANTTRNPAVSYVGLVHTCLGPTPAALDAAFGPTRLAVNTAQAKGKVPKSRWRTLAFTLGVMGSVARARLDGSYRRSPFFDPSGQPVAAPRVLSAQERKRAMHAG